MASRNKYRVTTDYHPLTLRVEINTKQPERVWLKVYDEYNPKRVFTHRFKTISGDETLWVRMPISPRVAVVSLCADANGKPISDNVTLKSVTKGGLIRKIDPSDIANPSIRSFVDFAQRFCFNMDELKPDQNYQSDDGKFIIQYVSKIIDRNSGKELTTPARIGKNTGIIQVSKKRMDEFTVPMRLAILLHEFSHFYLNEKMDDEMEADINGLLIYLSLGFPRIEAYQAFLETFQKGAAANEGNKARYDHLNKFIREFENMDMVIQ